ncbi:TrkH family potassium uptake protein [Natrinema salifodinae]|uniref:Trk system potassium uptake protein TrkH n=1 Tax=Natrinema salifodinae TaxID=1202768 RepID=A0A1I0M8T2_9EURY|nr:potassium transporter TrkG [Natrinema salifodinae]SEV84669.1 trk system potassium uptake protein TrkH [Natrinema salifodinae]
MDETLEWALYDFGTLVKVYGLLPALSIVVAAAWSEFYAIPAFAATALAAYGLGRVFERAFAEPDEDDMRSGVITVVVGWFVCGLLSAGPLLLVAWTVRAAPTSVGVLSPPAMTGPLATFLQPTNAVFEGMSGATGTGFSMASDPGELPRALQWWRSAVQWVGGIGVVVLAAAFVSSEESHTFSAVHGNRAPTESIRSTTTGTAAALWWLLALLTVASALLLWLAGMEPWAALNHAMTGVTTGGFTITASSIETYGDPVVELALLPVMIAGAVSFSLLFFCFRGDSDRIRGDVQTKWLFGALGLGSLAVVAVLALTAAYPTAAETIRYGTFQLVSGLTCTGFQTDTNLGGAWAEPATLLVASSMLVGGAAGSTAGGMKIIRARRVLVDIPERGMDVYEPSEPSAETAGSVTQTFDTAAAIAICWFVVLFATTVLALLVLPGEQSTANVLFEVASVQGNVGLSAGIVDPTIPPSLKLAFVVAMWVGRLEIVPVIVTGSLLLDKVR